jgi:peptide methionine sulfoxide reductase MsrB
MQKVAKNRSRNQEALDELEARVTQLEENEQGIMDDYEWQADKSFLVCPDCAKDGGTTRPLYWVNADQLSFGDYVEVRAEARCKECDSYWQIKIPQMVRAQPQNRLSAIGVF